MQLIDDLTAHRDEALKYYDLSEAELARTYRPGSWSVKYLLHHLADSEVVMYDRICRTISEPRQTLLVYDQDAWASSLDYSQVPLELPRQVFGSVRNMIIHYAGRFYESHGHLEFVHSVDGVRTLRSEFEKVGWHTAHHLAQIRQALS